MKIITLCGSAIFKFEFEMVNRQYTMEGNIVLAPSVFCNYAKHPLSDETMTKLKEVHFKKIEMADEIFIVSDTTEYYGEDTKKDIEYAKSIGKPVFICIRKSCCPMEIKTIESYFENKPTE